MLTGKTRFGNRVEAGNGIGDWTAEGGASAAGLLMDVGGDGAGPWEHRVGSPT